MDALIRLSGLWQGRQQQWRGVIVSPSNLAAVAASEMVLDVGIHARPEKGLQDPFLRFELPIVPRQHGPMGFSEDIVSHRRWGIDDDPIWFGRPS